MIGCLGTEVILKEYKNSKGFLSHARLRLLCTRYKNNMKSFFIPSCVIRENGTCLAPSKAFQPLQLCLHGASALGGLWKLGAEYMGALSFQGFVVY